jgi:sterol desaturase/sphingolipid hydroxylase (fatty acid hydroxylase superfamily)
MDAIEPFLGKMLSTFLGSSTGFFLLLFLGRAIFFTTMEVVWPARPVPYRAVIWNDLVASMAYAYVIFPLAGYLSRTMIGYHPFPAMISEWPLILRVALYFLLADFGHDWIHRLMSEPQQQSIQWHSSGPGFARKAKRKPEGEIEETKTAAASEAL